ncbi:ferric reductase-like transmembrane domain-containing protein [Streptacidiphilus sp. N1-3]|uniref:Ferric reductase-like transmembrane domain-containing protein n=1 Tax=Streptacidiphilus alkalitolerans TaxID=3342712 RepID=A0ABV6XDF8_9ACTN
MLLGLALGAVAVAASWWRAGGSSLDGGDAVDAAARLAGLLAGYTGVVMLALMARAPLVERTVGSTRLARTHALGGRLVVLLMSVHALLATAHWAEGASAAQWRGLAASLVQHVLLLEAVIAFLLLLGAAVASIRSARRRLGYTAWHAVHTTTYAATTLGLGHQLVGPDLAGRPLARAAWCALYAVTALLLVRYRLVEPLRAARRHRLRVAAVVPEGPGVVSVLITGQHLAELRSEAGQFFRWRFLAAGLWWTANPYSLSAPPRGDSLRITVKALGPHSRALARLRPGTRVWARGPYGGLTGRSGPPARKVLLLGGGIGIAPLRALFETLPGEVTLIYRARRAEDLVLRSELDAIAATRAARVIYAIDGSGADSLPLTGRALRAAVPDIADHVVYLAGPPGMTAAAERSLRRAGVPRRHVHCEALEI